MRFEITMMGATILLAITNIMWAGNIRTKQYGIEWNMGARDEPMPSLNPLAGRLLRAQANLYETLPLFIGALLGAIATTHLGWKTELGSGLYFTGRLIYLPLYAAGIPKLRTVVWLISMLGLLLVLWAMILG